MYKYNKWAKGLIVKRKKIKDQRKFILLQDQAIRGKKTKKNLRVNRLLYTHKRRGSHKK
jgi:hypothetical protein